MSCRHAPANDNRAAPVMAFARCVHKSSTTEDTEKNTEDTLLPNEKNSDLRSATPFTRPVHKNFTTEDTEVTENQIPLILCVLCVLRGGELRSVRNGRHLSRSERFEKRARLFEIELGIARLDAEKESIAAGEREARHVENGVIGLRQPVQGEHAQDRRQRGAEDRAFEGHRDECQPAV